MKSAPVARPSVRAHAGQDAERFLRVAVGDRSQNPHTVMGSGNFSGRSTRQHPCPTASSGLHEVRMKKSRRLSLMAAPAVILLVAGIWGFSTINGASASIDPSKLAAAEEGTMLRSVVATGKIEPITKVEIKSKANGIIEQLLVDVDSVVQPGQVLAELDKENLTARLREARANLQAAEAAHEAAIAQLRKNEIEAESPDVAFASRNQARAQQLFDQKLVSQSALDEATTSLEQAENRQRAAAGQLVIARARVAEANANIAQARAAVERSEEELANATIKAPIKATVLTRDVEVGSPVSSILNLGANATLVHDPRRHRAGVRPRARGRGGHRPRAARAAGEDHDRDVPRSRLRRPRHANLADRRRARQRDDIRGRGVHRQPRPRAEGQHDGECRDHPRGVRRARCSFPKRP